LVMARNAHITAMVAAATVASAMFLAVVITSSVHTRRTALLSTQKLYNKWGTNDDNDHWGGVGSENYHTAKYDNTGSNIDYHPRDSSSGDGDSMEPAWWRQGPGANSEYTGHAMDGELYSPPDEKIFKPFFMKQDGVRASQLYDVDGPSPRDPPPSAWAAAGKGTTAWMLKHEGPLLASEQDEMEDSMMNRIKHDAETPTAKQVWKAEHPDQKGALRKVVKGRNGNEKLVTYTSANAINLEDKTLNLEILPAHAPHRAPSAKPDPKLAAQPVAERAAKVSAAQEAKEHAVEQRAAAAGGVAAGRGAAKVKGAARKAAAGGGAAAAAAVKGGVSKGVGVESAAAAAAAKGAAKGGGKH